VVLYNLTFRAPDASGNYDGDVAEFDKYGGTVQKPQ